MDNSQRATDTQEGVKIYLHGRRGEGMYALVDPADVKLVSGRKWYLATNKSRMRYALACIYRDGIRTSLYMHQLIRPDLAEIDHHNCSGLDNRRQNLREATTSHNQMNRTLFRSNKTGYKGVCQLANGTWRATIQYATVIVKNSFATAEEAAQAYDELARQYHKGFARLNFPEEGELSAREVLK